MRIKKDKTSWHAGGVIARDARHEKSPDNTAKHLSKKNTKRWCKGKVGREHQGEWVRYYELKHDGGRMGKCNWRIFVCKRCQKHLNRSYPWGFVRNPKGPGWLMVDPEAEPTEKATCKCGRQAEGVKAGDAVYFTCTCGYAWKTGNGL